MLVSILLHMVGTGNRNACLPYPWRIGITIISRHDARPDCFPSLSITAKCSCSNFSNSVWLYKNGLHQHCCENGCRIAARSLQLIPQCLTLYSSVVLHNMQHANVETKLDCKTVLNQYAPETEGHPSTPKELPEGVTPVWKHPF